MTNALFKLCIILMLVVVAAAFIYMVHYLSSVR